MNHVTVVIEKDETATDFSPASRRRVEVMVEFQTTDFTRVQVLEVFEDALRGAGYFCPIDALNVDDGPEPK